MVMTFILHPLSHYNTITDPRAQFLFSLIEGLTVDFPSHSILSLIDVFRDMATNNIMQVMNIILKLLVIESKIEHLQ